MVASLLFHFCYEVSSNKFVTNNATIAHYAPYKNIRVFTDKTPFKNDVLRSRKFAANSEVGMSLFVRDTTHEQHAASTDQIQSLLSGFQITSPLLAVDSSTSHPNLFHAQ